MMAILFMSSLVQRGYIHVRLHSFIFSIVLDG